MRDIVIVGGGIIGCSTAHFLRKLGGDELRITIIDKVGIAACASGRSGGFLARDWHAEPTSALVAHSFGLHAQLAEEFGAAEIGYRACQAVQARCNGGDTVKKGNLWYDGCHDKGSIISPRETSAQVIPSKLTQALYRGSCKASLLIYTKHKPDSNHHP